MRFATYIIAWFLSAFVLVPAFAGEITDAERQNCRADYKVYCGEYGLGTEALRACMSRNVKRLSHACVGALVDAREMTQAQADKLRSAKTGKAKRTTRKRTTRHRHHH